MNWGLLWTGLGALVVVAIIGVVIAYGQDGSSLTSNGVWLVAFLPIAATVAGAVLLAGRDPER